MAVVLFLSAVLGAYMGQKLYQYYEGDKVLENTREQNSDLMNFLEIQSTAIKESKDILLPLLVKCKLHEVDVSKEMDETQKMFKKLADKSSSLAAQHTLRKGK